VVRYRQHSQNPDNLFALARVAGGLTDLRIAIVCLPDQDQCIVTMAFVFICCLRYRIGEADVTDRTTPTTMEVLISPLTKISQQNRMFSSGSLLV
jgi:hypothetical protein